MLNIIGNNIWRRSSNKLQRAYIENNSDIANKSFKLDDLNDLPKPVKIYLGKVLPVGLHKIGSVALEQKGKFNVGKEQPSWFDFSAQQQVSISNSSFIWDAKINFFPGISFFVIDAYLQGYGLLKVKLMGLFPLIKKENIPAIDRSELIRYLAEAVWYPTALLPGNNLKWQALDDSSAIAHLINKDIEIALQFNFNRDGFVESVISHDRARTVADEYIPTSWIGYWDDYRNEDGMLIPHKGEVAWIIDDSVKTYWKGEITTIKYHYNALAEK